MEGSSARGWPMRGADVRLVTVAIVILPGGLSRALTVSSLSAEVDAHPKGTTVRGGHVRLSMQAMSTIWEGGVVRSCRPAHIRVRILERWPVRKR
jgi:hypothetical protein